MLCSLEEMPLKIKQQNSKFLSNFPSFVDFRIIFPWDLHKSVQGLSLSRAPRREKTQQIGKNSTKGLQNSTDI